MSRIQSWITVLTPQNNTVLELFSVKTRQKNQIQIGELRANNPTTYFFLSVSYR